MANLYSYEPRKKAKSYSTPNSRVVPHRSTTEASPGLTSEIGRDPVHFRVYGRSWSTLDGDNHDIYTFSHVICLTYGCGVA
jgi:hypothetical protein